MAAIYSKGANHDELDEEILKKATNGTLLQKKFDELKGMSKSDFDGNLRSEWREVIKKLYGNLKQ